MASIVTFDGAHLGDEWSADATTPTPSWLGDAAYTFLGWGVVTFAVATGAMRAWRGLGLSGKLGLKGARRRRRR